SVYARYVALCSAAGAVWSLRCQSRRATCAQSVSHYDPVPPALRPFPTRRSADLLVLILASTSLAAAAPPPPLVEYSKPAFAAAQAENRPIVVFVHASWCVTCRKQQPIVQELASDGAFKGQKLVVFVVDYADKAPLKDLN